MKKRGNVHNQTSLKLRFRPKTALHNGRSIETGYDKIGRIASVSLMNGSSEIHSTALAYVPGADMDANGAISISDAVIILRMAMGLTE